MPPINHRNRSRSGVCTQGGGEDPDSQEKNAYPALILSGTTDMLPEAARTCTQCPYSAELLATIVPSTGACSGTYTMDSTTQPGGQYMLDQAMQGHVQGICQAHGAAGWWCSVLRRLRAPAPVLSLGSTTDMRPEAARACGQ